MNKKIITLILASSMILSSSLLFTSCGSDADEKDNEVPESEGYETLIPRIEEEKASKINELISAYYTDINACKFDNITKYFVSGYDVASEIEGLKFGAEFFESTYEIIKFEVFERDDNKYGVSVQVKHTSKNKVSGETFIYNEPYYYIIADIENPLIESYSQGESEIITTEL